MIGFLVHKFIKDYQNTENAEVRTSYGVMARGFNTCSRIKSLETAEMRYFFVKFFFTFCCICCIIVYMLFTAVMK